MKMNDFDNNLKETLEAREIRPSASNWDKLAHELDQEEKKSKIPFWWLGIAAVFLGGIVIGGLVFSNSSTIPTNTPAVVEETPAESILVEPAAISAEPLVAPKQKITERTKLVTNTEKKKKTPEQTARNAAQGNNLAEKSIVAVLPSSKELLKEQNTKKAGLDHLEQKVAETALTVETEKLLREAQLQIEKRAFLAHPKNTISAQALLQQAELELNRPKRDRLFDFVQDKIIQMASASRVFD